MIYKHLLNKKINFNYYKYLINNKVVKINL
jgi:hypothetical protein